MPTSDSIPTSDSVPTARSLYASFVKPLARRAGLHDRIAGLYWRARFVGHPETLAHEIDGTTARFRVSTTEELRRFESLRDERPVIRDLLGALEPGDVAFDVGANVGAYTCFLAQRLPADRVVAFEPHPTNLDALRANLARNGVDATLVETALSNGSGTGELTVDSHDAGAGEHALAASGGGADASVRTGGDDHDERRLPGHRRTPDHIEVDLAAGDDLVDREVVPAPTILKIDVEGAERRVLEGLSETLASGPVRLAYVEVHPDRTTRYGDDTGDVRTHLADRGFTVERLAERGGEYFLRARAE